MTYRCPRPSCDERNELEFATADERVDHLVNGHGKAYSPAAVNHDHEYCITDDGVAPDCPNYGGQP